MDFNIDPLLNMTFDENGINDFFTLYENQIDQELTAFKSTAFIKNKIQENQHLLDFEDYDKINDEIDICAKFLELSKIRDQFYITTDDLEKSFDIKDHKNYDFINIQEINNNFSEYIVNITENILTSLIEIDISSVSLAYKSSFKTIRKEIIEKIYLIVNSKAEKLLTPSNNKIISLITQKTNLPLIDNSQVIIEEPIKNEICEYFTTLLNLGIHMENFTIKCHNFLEIDQEFKLNFYEEFFSQSYAKSLKDAVKFHFLTERKTNRVDKPEWLFTFIQHSIEINLNAFSIIGVKSSLKFFSRNLYTVFGEDIITRYNDDYEDLINDNILLLHFFDSLENFESNMMKFFNTDTEVYKVSNIFQKILLKRRKTIDDLLLYEKFLFEDKVFDTFQQIDYSTPSKKINQKKQLDIFSILENYCILYKKLFKKYQFITNENLFNEIRKMYKSEILKTLLEKLMHSLDNFLKQKHENKTIIIFKNYWVILKNLKAFYKDQHQGLLLKEIQLEIRDFKNDFIMRETKSMIEKSMKTLTNNNLRVFFKSSRILNLLTSKEKIDFEERDNKKNFNEMILIPFEIEFEYYTDNIFESETLGLLSKIKKEINKKMFEFLFQGIFSKYKMTEYGSLFAESFFNQTINIFDKKIKEKTNQISIYYKRKLRESFAIFKNDKKDIEKLIEAKENQEKENSKQGEKNEVLSFFTLEELNILNKATYIKIF